MLISANKGPEVQTEVQTVTLQIWERNVCDARSQIGRETYCILLSQNRYDTDPYPIECVSPHFQIYS
jgi:hypothetical protein